MKYRKGDVVAIHVRFVDVKEDPADGYKYIAETYDNHNRVPLMEREIVESVALGHQAGDIVRFGMVDYSILHIDGGQAFVKSLTSGRHEIIALPCLERK